MAGSHKLLLALVTFTTIACGQSADEISGAPSASEADVVGVEDLAPLEAELGLVKDVKVNGVWTRDVKRGDCWQRAQAAEPKWEFRRYKNGAAFFDKKGTAPATGDSRPVLCLDLESDIDSVSLD